MQKILVTGASSELMQQTLKHVNTGEFQLLGITRNKSLRSTEDMEYLYGDINDTNFLRSSTEGVDMVIHAAGISHSSKASEYLRINVKGTENLIHAALAAGVQKFVFISSRTAGERNGAYAQSKFQAEKILIKQVSNWLILRPSEIFGGNSTEGINQLIETLQRKSWILCPVNLKHKLFPIHLEDAGRVIYEHIFASQTHNEIITINGKQGFSFYELIKYISDVFGKKVLIIPVPRVAMYMLMYFLKLTGLSIGMVADQVPRLYGAKSMQEPMGDMTSLKAYLEQSSNG